MLPLDISRTYQATTTTSTITRTPTVSSSTTSSLSQLHRLRQPFNTPHLQRLAFVPLFKIARVQRRSCSVPLVLQQLLFFLLLHTTPTVGYASVRLQPPRTSPVGGVDSSSYQNHCLGYQSRRYRYLRDTSSVTSTTHPKSCTNRIQNYYCMWKLSSYCSSRVSSIALVSLSRSRSSIRTITFWTLPYLDRKSQFHHKNQPYNSYRMTQRRLQPEGSSCSSSNTTTLAHNSIHTGLENEYDLNIATATNSNSALFNEYCRDDEDVDDLTLERLQDRVAMYVQKHHQQQQQQQFPLSDHSNSKVVSSNPICVVIAGGGGHFVSTLAATSGASSILLEGTIPYSRPAFIEYVQQHMDTTKTNGISSSSTNTTRHINEETFKYCSEDASQRLAYAAYQRALHLTTTKATTTSNTVKSTSIDNNNNNNSSKINSAPDTKSMATTSRTNWTNVLRGVGTSVMGVASTSVLQSTLVTTTASDGSHIRTQTRRSVELYGSRAYCAIYTNSGLQVQLHVQFAKELVPPFKNYNEDNIDSRVVPVPAPNRCRTRLEEDVLVSHYLLSCMELYRAKNRGDVINILNIVPEVDDAPHVLQHNKLQHEIVIRGKTKQGDQLSVKLPSSLFDRNTKPVPDDVAGINVNKSIPTVDDPLRRAAERILSGQDEVVMILLPSISNSTVEVMDVTMLPPQSLVVPGSFNPIHVGHIALAVAAAKAMNKPCNAIWFELSVTNVDKPALAIDTIIERINYFFPLRHEIPDDICWGILLTNAPLFKQKVDLLSPLQLNAKESRLHFSIGTDTLVRLIDPKYYDNSESKMLQALDDMSCHFVVGGRLDQKRLSDCIFIAGDEVIESLPQTIHCKFTILPDFRIDLSSTEIRQQMEAEKRNL
jgi:nicotinic acid mononucleotide adenylyltransferase